MWEASVGLLCSRARVKAPEGARASSRLRPSNTQATIGSEGGLAINWLWWLARFEGGLMRNVTGCGGGDPAMLGYPPTG